MTTRELEKKAMNLNPIDKIHLVEKLLTSLDKPDSEIEKLWVKESQSRIGAYERGTLKTISYDNVNEI